MKINKDNKTIKKNTFIPTEDTFLTYSFKELGTSVISVRSSVLIHNINLFTSNNQFNPLNLNLFYNSENYHLDNFFNNFSFDYQYKINLYSNNEISLICPNGLYKKFSYFYNEGNISYYFEEDVTNGIIIKKLSDNTYELIDDQFNKMIFNENGYITKYSICIGNSQFDIEISYTTINSKCYISSIFSSNETITFVYEDNNISINLPDNTSVVLYGDNKRNLIRILNKYNENLILTYSDFHGCILLNSIYLESGLYKVNFAYNDYSPSYGIHQISYIKNDDSILQEITLLTYEDEISIVTNLSKENFETSIYYEFEEKYDSDLDVLIPSGKLVGVYNNYDSDVYQFSEKSFGYEFYSNKISKYEYDYKTSFDNGTITNGIKNFSNAEFSNIESNLTDQLVWSFMFDITANNIVKEENTNYVLFNVSFTYTNGNNDLYLNKVIRIPVGNSTFGVIFNVSLPFSLYGVVNPNNFNVGINHIIGLKSGSLSLSDCYVKRGQNKITCLSNSFYGRDINNQGYCFVTSNVLTIKVCENVELGEEYLTKEMYLTKNDILKNILVRQDNNNLGLPSNLFFYNNLKNVIRADIVKITFNNINYIFDESLLGIFNLDDKVKSVTKFSMSENNISYNEFNTYFINDNINTINREILIKGSLLLKEIYSNDDSNIYNIENSYNEKGQLINSILNGDNNKINEECHTYNNLNLLQSSTSLLANNSLQTTTFSYNNKNLLTSINDNIHFTNSLEYDVKDRTSKISFLSDQLVSECNISYDETSYNKLDNNRLQYIFNYDDKDDVTSIVLRNLLLGTDICTIASIEKQYESDRVISIISYPNGYKIKNTYNKFGKLVKIETGTVGSDTYSEYINFIYYDSILNNVNEQLITDPFDSNLIVTSSSLLRKLLSGGKSYYYSYDSLNRIISLNWNNEGNVTYQYDVLNDVDNTKNTLYNRTIKYDYQTSNNSSTSGFTTKFFYNDDLTFNIYKFVTIINDTNVKKFNRTYDYDTNGRLNVVHDISPNGSEVTYEFGYNDTNTLLSNGLVKCDLKINSNIYRSWNYAYDNSNNIASISVDNRSYEYDAFNRLVRENNEYGDYTKVYEYDTYGNILSKKKYRYTNGIIDENLLVSTINYGYNNDDLLTSYDGNVISYNSSRSISQYQGFNYSYDRFGRLTSISKGAILAGITSTTFTYDKFGNKTGKRKLKSVKEPGSGPFVPAVITDETIEEYEILDNKIIGLKHEYYSYSDLTSSYYLQFVYKDDSVIGFYYNNVYYRYVKSPTNDIELIIDENNNVVGEYHYDAWGNILNSGSLTSIARKNPFRYKGYFYDNETQLYWVSSRYYSPELCRWISPDSIEYLDPESINGLNLYCYCMNNPISYCDPSGHSAILVALLVGAIVGGVIGGVYGGLTACANDQNVFAGVLIGIGAGALMGAGAGVASLYLAPVIVGKAAVVGGVIYSTGAALAIGSGIAFGSGFIGGMAANALTQVANDDGVNDWGSVIVSGVQWGFINTASAFLGSLGGPVSTLDSALLSGVFGSVTSAVGMTVDILRNRKNQKQKSYVNNQLYAYGF